MSTNNDRVYWQGETACDCCGMDCNKGKLRGGILIDCYVPEWRTWGVLCGDCAKQFRIKYGVGRGQMYALDINDRFVKVNG